MRQFDPFLEAELILNVKPTLYQKKLAIFVNQWDTYVDAKTSIRKSYPTEVGTY